MTRQQLAQEVARDDRHRPGARSSTLRRRARRPEAACASAVRRDGETAPWPRPCPRPRRSCWCRGASPAPCPGSTLNSAGTRIRPPPPTIESTKPANSEARVSTNISMRRDCRSRACYRIRSVGRLPLRSSTQKKRRRPAAPCSKKRHLVRMPCVDYSDSPKMSPRSPALRARPVCEWRDFRSTHRASASGLPANATIWKRRQISVPLRGPRRPPSPPSSAWGCWCCRW